MPGSVLDEGKTLNDVFQAQFLGQLGRLEPTEVVPRLQKLSAPRNGNNPNYRNDVLAEVAVQLAADQPALAEQVFNLRDSSGDQNQAIYTEIRLCRRLARVDPALCEAGGRVAHWHRHARLWLGIRCRRPGRERQGRRIRGARSRDPERSIGCGNRDRAPNRFTSLTASA